MDIALLRQICIGDRFPYWYLCRNVPFGNSFQRGTTFLLPGQHNGKQTICLLYQAKE